MRRLRFALAPLLVLLGLAELVGRARPAPGTTDLARLYEPGAALVSGEAARATAHPELHAQRWVVPAPGFRAAFVGDSTVWGQLPDAFAQGLRVPGQDVEVLNFGLRGAASDRARIGADAALDQDLDLLVVYVGHNEVTEARLNPVTLRPFWARRLSAAVLRSGTARLLAPLLAPLRADGAAGAAETAGGEASAGALGAKGDAAARPLAPAEWPAVEANYRRNLAAICDAAGTADVPVVFVAPIGSLVFPGAAPDGAAPTLGEAMQSGLWAARQGDFAGALAWADRLGGYYPALGPPRALRGIALVGLGRRDEGLAELYEARRRDAQPARATEAHLAVLREVTAACGAPLVEPEPTFLADPRYLHVDDPLFMDRVHPTLPGNVLLAGVIAAGAPLPAGAGYDPARVTLAPPADEAARGWRLLDARGPSLGP